MNESKTRSQQAIETTGIVDEEGHLHLDEPLPSSGPRAVRVILLLDPEEDIDEQEWLHAASRNPAFDFLQAPEEDIYTDEDGEPFDEDV